MMQANKKGCDCPTEMHCKKYHIDKLIAGIPLSNDLMREDVGDVNGKSLVHLLCHTDTDRSS
jgi:hypothetical protein